MNREEIIKILIELKRRQQQCNAIDELGLDISDFTGHLFDLACRALALQFPNYEAVNDEIMLWLVDVSETAFSDETPQENWGNAEMFVEFLVKNAMSLFPI